MPNSNSFISQVAVIYVAIKCHSACAQCGSKASDCVTNKLQIVVTQLSA